MAVTSLVSVILHVLAIVECTLAQGFRRAGISEFTYNIDPRDFTGVNNWHLSYSTTCAGYHQSPVDIQTRRLYYNPRLQCPAIYYKSRLVRGEMGNDGKYDTFAPDDPYVLKIVNAPYRPGQYFLHGFHIHYGGRFGRGRIGKAFPGRLHPGSEHTVNGRRYDGEVHMLFRNSNSRGPSITDEEDLVVVAIFVKVLPKRMIKDFRFTRYLQDNVPDVLPINATKTVYVEPGMFLDGRCSYYTYSGSTTTPSCQQTVRWVVLTQPVHVTRSAWYMLSWMESRGGYESLYGNYRERQPMRRRLVETNMRPRLQKRRKQYPIRRKTPRKSLKSSIVHRVSI